MGCQSGLTGARFDIKMRLVKSSAFFVDKGIDVDYKRSRCWRVGREARQRTANPSTAVRIRYSPFRWQVGREARQRTANPSTAVRIRYLPFGLSKESLFFCHVMHRPPKHHRLRVAINREGVLFVFFWLALGAAAIYSGNAGLMILFCMLTAAFALVSALAHRNMQPLEVVRRFPEDIFAQRNAHIDVLMTNRSAIPVYGLHLYERFDDAHCIGPIYVARLAPGETARARYMCIFDARGVAQFSTFEVRSRFPVPIFEWRQTIEASDMARVYPRYEPGTDLIAFCEEESTAPPPTDRPRFQTEMHTIAELRHGRRRGRILWKLSAKKGKIYEDIPIRNKRHAQTSHIVVEPARGRSRVEYEREIAQVATFCTQHACDGRLGSVRLGTTVYRFGASHDQWRRLLNALSEFDLATDLATSP